GRGSRRQLNTGAAAALVAGGLPAAVANQYKVLDQSATSFAQFFYWALAQGMSVARAAREARIALKYSIEGETIDWAVRWRRRLLRRVAGALSPAMCIALECGMWPT